MSDWNPEKYWDEHWDMYEYQEYDYRKPESEEPEDAEPEYIVEWFYIPEGQDEGVEDWETIEADSAEDAIMIFEQEYVGKKNDIPEGAVVNLCFKAGA